MAENLSNQEKAALKWLEDMHKWLCQFPHSVERMYSGTNGEVATYIRTLQKMLASAHARGPMVQIRCRGPVSISELEAVDDAQMDS